VPIFWGTFSPWLLLLTWRWQVLLNCLHFFVPWRLQVCPRVSYCLLCYMGTPWGLQCYDHLGWICAVLTVHKRQYIIAHCSRVLEKVTFAHLVKKFPALMENKHSFLDWKVPATEGYCDTVNCFFFWWYVVRHPPHRCKCYCCRSSRFAFYLVRKIKINGMYWLKNRQNSVF
jgi:hypothetical protein